MRVLVHHCFDWMLGNPIEIPDGKGAALAIVNPNARCSCSKRVGSEERNRLLKEQKACVILIPGTGRGNFLEIVEKVEPRIPTAQALPATIVEAAYIYKDEEAVETVEAHGEFFNLALKGLGADQRKRERISPAVHVMEPQPDDGSVLYIRVDQTPEYTKAFGGCGHVPETDYMECRTCGRKVSYGRDLNEVGRLRPDKLREITCPYCGDREGFVFMPTKKAA